MNAHAALILWRGLLNGRLSWVLFGFVFAYYVVVQLYYEGFDVADWDVLVLSGWATTVVGLRLAGTIPSRMHHTVERLFRRGSFRGDEAALSRVRDQLENDSRRWGIGIGLFVAIAFLLASAWAFSGRIMERVPFLSFALPGGFVIGFHAGRMILYGQLGRILDSRGIRIRVTAGHVDEVGGLKPVGHFFFFQAMVVAIPAFFLATWWFLIPIGWPERYGYWREPYLVLLVLALVLELLAFFLPLRHFHKIMLTAKGALVEGADELVRAIADMQEQLHSRSGLPDETRLRERLEEARDRYAAIERLPTWPVDSRTRRRFGLNNLGLLLPLVGKLLGGAELWKDLSNILTGLES